MEYFFNSSRVRLAPVVASSLFLFPLNVAFANTEENVAITSGVVVSENGAVTTYLANYFEPFNPFSVGDMIDRIPGVSIAASSATEERRGLRGNEDAILVNGQQITGKDSGGISSLQRISAGNVKYIEVIRGATAELQGTTGRIINIVLNENAGRSISMSTAFLRYAGDNTYRVNPQITFSSISPNKSYTLEFQNSRIYRPWARSKLTSDALGAGIIQSDEFEQYGTGTTKASGRMDRRFATGATLQVNGLLQAVRIDRQREEVVGSFTDMLALPFNDILENEDRDRYTAELSTDYNFPVGDGKNVTVLGVFNWEKEIRDRTVRDNLLEDSPIVFEQDRTDLRLEAIGRSVFDWALSSKSSVQIGFEGAFNSQRTEFELLRLEDGVLTPAPIFNSNGTVEEYRGELFTSTTRTMWDVLTVEAGLAVEKSQITQTGTDVDSSRSLTFIKPSLTTFLDITGNTKVIFSAGRDVDQLDFSEFVSSISERDEELEAGNPDLLPERSWDVDLGVEYRLAGGAGVLNLNSFYRYVEDVSGRRVFESLVSQPSNIGNGYEYGIEAEASLQLSQIGLWSGVFTSRYLRRETSVDDPLTGLARPFDSTPDWEIEIEYNHDVNFPLKNGALEFKYTQEAQTFVHDVNYIEAYNDGPQLRVGYAGQINDSVNFNFSVTNVLNSKPERDRQLFTLSPDLQQSYSGQRFERHEWGRLFTLYVQAAF